MGKIIKDIKVVRPEDKLIILIEGDNPDLNRISDIAKEFMSMKADRGVLVISNKLQPYIIKKGAKISLATIIETKLTKEDK